MKLDLELLEALAVEFLRKSGSNTIKGDLLPESASINLGSRDQMYGTIYAAKAVIGGIDLGKGKSDTVDGFHASETPTPHVILPLNDKGIFPTSVYPEAILTSGGVLSGDLNVKTGVKIAGVDLAQLSSQYKAHIATAAATAHGSVGTHDHATIANGGDLTQYANSEGSGTRSAYMAERLHRQVTVGKGLTGGGWLNSDISINVSLGSGLEFSSSGSIQLSTPGTLSSTSVNQVQNASHTHTITASSAPLNSSLLMSDNSGSLTLQGMTVNNGLFIGGLANAGTFISRTDAIVGNKLDVGSGFLVVTGLEKKAYLNTQPGPDQIATLNVAGNPMQPALLLRASSDPGTPILRAEDANTNLLFMVDSAGTLQSGSPLYVSGQKGWRITRDGDAEFRNLNARGELHTSVFIKDEIHASGGSLMVIPAGMVKPAKLTTDNVIGVVGATFTLIVGGSESTPGACLFSTGDVIRMKYTAQKKD